MSYDDEFMTYDEYQQELLNDQYPDDGYSDPDFRADDGYCPHGKYVGGCGADIMCSWCEDGISPEEAREIITMERTRKVRDAATRCQEFINVLLSKHGTEIGGIAVWELSQDAPYRVYSPLGRYGRH